MRVLLLVLCVGSSFMVSGQGNTLGIFGGPSLCRLHGNDVFKQVDPIAGYQFGGFYMRWFNKGFGVHAQLSLARMGGALDYIGFNANGDETTRDHIHYRLDHLGLSLGGGFRTPGRIHGLLQFGIMPTLVAKAEVRSPDAIFHPVDVIVTDLTNKANSPIWFLYGGFGGAVDLKAPLSIGLLIRYDHGLTTLSRTDFFENEHLLETSWTVSLSVAYRWSSVK